MTCLAIFSHTAFSRAFQPGGLGESIHAEKLLQLLSGNYTTFPIVDIYEIVSKKEQLKKFQDFAQINLALAEADQEIIESCQSLELKNHLQFPQKTVLLWLSWNVNLAGLYATGLHLEFPTVVKLYVFHPNEKIFSQLYSPACFIITECLLANMKGMQYGIPAHKMLYLPHHFPYVIETIRKEDKKAIRKNLLSRLGLINQKEASDDPSTTIIGCVSRLQYRKNVEYSLAAIKKFHQSHPDKKIYFVLKGEIDQSGEWDSSYSYHQWIAEVIEEYTKEPWFLWDREFTPYEECLKMFKAFDLALHLSGAEGASNVVVDFLALGIPVILQDSTTNPYLFNESAVFVKSGLMRPGPLPFTTPDEKDLYEKLEKMILNKQSRLELAEKALEIANKRFHPNNTLSRFPLLLKAALEPKNPDTQNQVREQFFLDLKEYHLESKVLP